MDERAAGSTDGRRGDGGRRREAVRRTMADPAEVANLMVYLASDLSSHITGQGIQINGGSHY